MSKIDILVLRSKNKEMEEYDAIVTPPPPKLPPAQNTLQTASLLVIATILVAVALANTRSMMIPFVFALFLSYFVSPWVALLKHKARFPHSLAVICSILAFLCICAFFILVLRGSVLKMIASFYLYEEKLAQVGQDIVSFFARFDIKLDHSSLMERLRDMPVITYLQSAAELTIGFVADFLLVLVFLIFLVSGSDSGEKKSGLAGEIDLKVRAYIVTKILSNLLAAVCLWIIYVAMGLDLAFMFAMLSFILCFIPTLGSIIAVALPLPIAYLQYEKNWPIWAIVIGSVLVQIVIGNFLEPKFLGRGLDLHPVTILLSLMFWGLIWGVAGMFLAVPITAVLKIVLEKHPITHGFSEMLAGRSPI
jgi:AI-2 transport protein TqsA